MKTVLTLIGEWLQTNILKALFYVAAIILALWLGSVVWDKTIGHFFAPTKSELQAEVKSQKQALEVATDINKEATATIDRQSKSVDVAAKVIEDHYKKQEKTKSSFDSVLNNAARTDQSFDQKQSALATARATVVSSVAHPVVSAATAAKEDKALDDARAQAQIQTLWELYCLANPANQPACKALH